MSAQIPPAPTTEPPASAPAKKPIWKRWWFWVAAVVVVLIIASALGGGGDTASNDGADERSPAAEDTETDADDSAGIGDPVDDGQFTFTVQSVKCGKSSIGSGVFRKRPRVNTASWT